MDRIDNVLPSAQRHPDVDEAWAIAVRAMDERDTVIRTAQIAEAWSVAQSVMALGDEVGARMAFKACYARLLDVARAQGLPTRWEISLGYDQELRAMRTHEAARLGLISMEVAECYALPAPVDSQALISGLVDRQLRIAARDGQVVDEVSKAIANLRNIKAMLTGKYEQFEDKTAEKDKQRAEFELKKAGELEKLSRRKTG